MSMLVLKGRNACSQVCLQGRQAPCDTSKPKGRLKSHLTPYHYFGFYLAFNVFRWDDIDFVNKVNVFAREYITFVQKCMVYARKYTKISMRIYVLKKAKTALKLRISAYRPGLQAVQSRIRTYRPDRSQYIIAWIDRRLIAALKPPHWGIFGRKKKAE